MKISDKQTLCGLNIYSKHYKFSKMNTKKNVLKYVWESKEGKEGVKAIFNLHLSSVLISPTRNFQKYIYDARFKIFKYLPLNNHIHTYSHLMEALF